MSDPHFGVSKIPENPSFRDAAVNSVAVVPLLARKENNCSAQSFVDLLVSLKQHAFCNEDLLMVVPNTSLTRPGDWRYDETPLKAYHWQHGCQRLQLFDGRPEHNKIAHEKLLGHSRNWIDILPSRRTAAVIGILNMRDCQSLEDLKTAKEELQFWAQRYSTPPYEVTVHGSTFERDMPITRLYVFDSFEVNNMDLNDNTIMAFPPTDEAHAQMMDLHLNVVISDLTVSIFCNLEKKVNESNEATQILEPTQSNQGFLKRYISSNTDETELQQSQNNKTLGVSQLAGLVSPDSKLAKESLTKSKSASSAPDASPAVSESAEIQPDSTLSKLPKLMTPLDDESVDLSSLTSKDVEALKKRNMARRVKWTADLCLLAGSPLDAYERYLKAAELCKTNALDPLWHALSLEGCAAAHIAMAEMGGYSVDEYLENNFQLPDEIMALAREDPAKRQPTSSTKQTLPEVIFALCDEAFNILNRSEKLSHLYAELLLKLAGYCADVSESHLRCRWGEGDGCYSGELGDQPRWEKTSVAQLTFNPLRTKDDADMIAINTFVRTKYVCELLNNASSIGCLDAATRVEVALRSIKICSDGVKATHWPGRKPHREKLLRKAAYFSAIAAETATLANCDKKSCIDLWMLASQLYSKVGNTNDSSGYGWATLRAFCYECLSRQGNYPICMEAAVQLRSLLADLEPDPEDEADIVSQSADEQSEADPSASNIDDSEGRSVAEVKEATIRASTASVEDAELQSAVASASQFAKSLRTQYNNFTAASPFLGQQSRWAYGDPVAPIEVPLSAGSRLCVDALELKAVWPFMDTQTCMKAQNKSLDRVASLQRAVSTSSSSKDIGLDLYGFGETSLPLYVASAMTMEAQDSLELECVKRKINQDKSEDGAMATFYNPFDKKSDGASATKVAAEEEIAMVVSFGNRLSIPVEVQRGQLAFDNSSDGRVKAASLAFTVPPNASSFAVHFPFTIRSRGSVDGNSPENTALYEVKGINLTCFGRSFFVPIADLKDASAAQGKSHMPASASLYPHMPTSKTLDSEDTSLNPKIEVYPCQPKLQVFFAETGAPADSITVPLSDGEVSSIPPLRLVNYLGPTSKALIECLEVFPLNSPRSRLYDSSAGPTAVENETEFVKDLIQELHPPPYKLRALTGKLNLDSINGDAKDTNVLHLQIAAAHNYCQQVPSGTTITMQFRYRGPCISGTDVWRKTQVVFNITVAKGPRISSIAFRPDLLSGTSFAALFRSNDAKAIKVASKPDVESPADPTLALQHVGYDADPTVCHTESIFVLTIANETRSILIASRADEGTCGFGNCTLPEVVVRPGVSARIPITIPRISRMNQEGSIINVLDELVARTCLKWEVRRDGESGSVNAKGYIRIPAACLHDVVGRYPSFLTQVCQPPCTISITLGKESSSAMVGKPLDVSMSVKLEDWVSKEVRKSCSAVLELRCVRKDRISSNQRDFAWAGKLRRRVALNETLTHAAKLIVCRPGAYVVSGFVRIKQPASQTGEVWWAPVSQTVVVPDTLLAASE